MADESENGSGKRIELRMGSAATTAEAAENADADTGGSGEAHDRNTSAGGAAGPSAGVAAGQPPQDRPVMGWIAVACGLLGIFWNGIVFVPIAFVCSIIALFMGQGMWAFLGFLTAIVGLLTSPGLWAVIGLGALAAYLGIPIAP